MGANRNRSSGAVAVAAGLVSDSIAVIRAGSNNRIIDN